MNSTTHPHHLEPRAYNGSGVVVAEENLDTVGKKILFDTEEEAEAFDMANTPLGTVLLARHGEYRGKTYYMPVAVVAESAAEAPEEEDYFLVSESLCTTDFVDSDADLGYLLLEYVNYRFKLDATGVEQQIFHQWLVGRQQRDYQRPSWAQDRCADAMERTAQRLEELAADLRGKLED